MSKKYYINKDTYVGDTGKQLKDITKIQEQNMNVISEMSNEKWVKICNIKHSNHCQGEFSFIKIFIGDGNNGRVDQNAYIDLICQMGWDGGDNNGRYGCNAELHGFLTGFTINNTKIKVLANSNIDYDVWFYSNRIYNRINYIVNTSKNTIVTTKGELSLTEPTGTECDLSYNSPIAYTVKTDANGWTVIDNPLMPYIEYLKHGVQNVSLNGGAWRAYNVSNLPVGVNSTDSKVFGSGNFDSWDAALVPSINISDNVIRAVVYWHYDGFTWNANHNWSFRIVKMRS